MFRETGDILTKEETQFLLLCLNEQTNNDTLSNNTNVKRKNTRISIRKKLKEYLARLGGSGGKFSGSNSPSVQSKDN